MARHLLLVVLLYSLNETKVRALVPPNLTATPLVITETDSVTLNCQTPSSVSVSRCYLYAAKKQTTKGFSCVQTLTGTELLQMAAKRSPVGVKVKCFYTVMDAAIKSTSPDSDPSTITISNLLPPKLTVNPLVITETDSVTLRCQPPSVSVSLCYFYILNRNPPETFSCLKTLTGSDLLLLARQSSPATVKVTCLYLVSHQSPRSHMSTITIHPPRPELTVNPPVITETDSVTLDCVTLPSVSVLDCSLYSMRTKIYRGISCHETLTGAELLLMADQSSPAEVEVTCYYTKEHKGGLYQSPRSSISFISIQQTISGKNNTASAGSSSSAPPTSMAQPTGDPATELWTARLLLVVAPGFGIIVGVIIMGVAFVCYRRRSGVEQLNRREPHNEQSDVYHVYATIPEEPAASALKDMQYSTIQPH